MSSGSFIDNRQATSSQVVEGTVGNDTIYASGKSDRIDGSAGNDSVIGGAGNDTLIGGLGNDSLSGGGGADDIFDDSGANSIFGADGNDILNSWAGSSYMDGGAGDDQIQIRYYYNGLWPQTGLSETATVLGGSGNDQISIRDIRRVLVDAGSEGDYVNLTYYATATINGGIGNDTIYSHTGSDIFTEGISIEGGEGEDLITSVASYWASVATISGGNGNDVINVGDRMISLGSLVEGGAGNDVITIDSVLQTTVTGGSGGDVFRLSNSIYDLQLNGTHQLATGKSVVEGYSDTYALFEAEPVRITDFTVGTNGDVLDLTELLNAVAIGFDGSNPFASGLLRLQSAVEGTLVVFDPDGNSGASVAVPVALLQGVSSATLTAANFFPPYPPDGSLPQGTSWAGTAGADTKLGTVGADTLSGADGNDSLIGEVGHDRLSGGSGNDTLNGGLGNDLLTGDAGDDALIDRQGENTLIGGTGNDLIISHGTINSIDGGDGNDTVQLNYYSTVPGTNDYWEPPFRDRREEAATITGGLGDDSIQAYRVGALSVNGGGGTDTIFADEYEYATIHGGGGNDQITASFGWARHYISTQSTWLAGDDGDDALTASASAGLDTAVTLSGGAGSDRLLVNGDAIRQASLDGGDGNDVLEVEQVLDATLTGGLGRDTFVINQHLVEISRQGARLIDQFTFYDNGGVSSSTTFFSASILTISDFQVGVGGDAIDLRKLFRTVEGFQGGNPFIEGYLALQQDASDTLLIFDRDAATGSGSGQAIVRLTNVVASTLVADNFSPQMSPSGATLPGITRSGSVNSDTLSGGAGADTLDGLAGDDRLVGDAGHDQLLGGAGNDTLFDDFGNDLLQGGDGNDILFDDFGYNTLRGGAGNDTIESWSANGSLEGGLGDDRLYINQDRWYSSDFSYESRRASTIEAGSYVVTGDQGRDQLFASHVDQLLLDGGADDDWISSNQVLSSTLLGGAGNDQIEFRFSNGFSVEKSYLRKTFVDGGIGDDVITSRIWNDGSVSIQSTILGGEGNDTIKIFDGYAWRPAQYLSVNGGAGNDILEFDSVLKLDISGGANSDVFVLNKRYLNGLEYENEISLVTSVSTDSSGQQQLTQQVFTFEPIRIHDFATGIQGDRLDFSDLLGAATNFNGDNPFVTGYLKLEQSGDQVLLQFDKTGSSGASGWLTVAILENTRADAFTGHNFVPKYTPDGRPLSMDLTGTANADTLTGGNGDDLISGGNGNDSLLGLDGDDLLDGGAGNDTLIGGAGWDVYVADSTSDRIIELSTDNSWDELYFNGTGTFTLADDASIEFFRFGGLDEFAGVQSTATFSAIGNNFSQDILGNSAANKLEGKGGDDWLVGYAGNDTLDGGAGNDSFQAATGNDSIIGGDGNDLSVHFHGWYSYNETVQNEIKAQGSESVFSNVWLSGGNDTFDGGAGEDTVLLFASESSISTSRDAQGRLVLSRGSENLTLTNVERVAFFAEPMSVTGDAMYDNLSAAQIVMTSDLLAGAASAGNDVLYRRGSGFYDSNSKTFSPNSAYQDQVVSFNGLAGNDLIFGTDIWLGNEMPGSDDTLSGADGNDSISGFAGNDSLDGGVGNDTLLGGDGSDLIFGGAGNDSLYGDGGVDRLNGGLGADFMAGGADQDVYWVDDSRDIVMEQLDAGELDPGSGSALPSDVADFVIAEKSWVMTAGSRIEVLVAAGALGSAIFGLSASVPEARIDLTGGAFGEGLIGSGADNKLDGVAGDDGLFGSAGNDTLLGGAGNDTLAGGVGNDSLDGGAGDDLFLFNQSSSFALGQLVVASNLLQYTGGSDTFDGGAGTDVLLMSGTIDDYVVTRINTTDHRVQAKAGGETALVRNIEQLAFGVVGSDPYLTPMMETISLSSLGVPSDFDDNLSPRDNTQRFDRSGGKGNDTITGSWVEDRLEGGEGNDSLAGGGGNDTLIGGAGNDVLVASIPSQTPVTPELITMEGGAGDDVYVIDDLSVPRLLTITDTAGNDTLRFNVYEDFSDLDVYVDGANRKVLVFVEREGSPSGAQVALLGIDTGVIETYERNQYDYRDGQLILTEAVRYGAVYAAQDAKTGIWNAKGTDKNDVILATTGAANVYDGGKGDDLIMVWAHTGSVVQGGEGFNDINVRFGTPNQLRVTEIPIGTLSYAWSSGGVEVNMEAGIGVAYDAKGEEVLGVDQFEGLANVLGGKGGDSLVGDGYNNVLDGADGNDTLAGGGGNDVLVGGAGNDTFVVNLHQGLTVASERRGAVSVSADTLTLEGGTDAKGTDTLAISGVTRYEDLRFVVGASSVKIGLYEASETLEQPGIVDYTLLADRGIEQVSFDLGMGAGSVYATNWGNLGTKGDDLVLAKATGGYALGGLGNDLVLGSGEDDLLLGGAGHDVLVGGGGEDRLLGGAGNDTIRLNRLDGDLVLGGAGSDTYVIGGASENPGGWASRILDFRLNEDFLRFEGYEAVSITAGAFQATRGMDGLISYGPPQGNPGEVLAVRLDGAGNLRFDASESVEVQLVGLSGIDTQAELSALMSRVTLG